MLLFSSSGAGRLHREVHRPGHARLEAGGTAGAHRPQQQSAAGQSGTEPPKPATTPEPKRKVKTELEDTSAGAEELECAGSPSKKLKLAARAAADGEPVAPSLRMCILKLLEFQAQTAAMRNMDAKADAAWAKALQLSTRCHHVTRPLLELEHQVIIIFKCDQRRHD